MSKSSGFTYVESISAFSICLFLILSVLPILTKVQADQYDSWLKLHAGQLLYERLEAYMAGDAGMSSERIHYQNHTFSLTWTEAGPSSPFHEACIEYQTKSGKTEVVCDAAK
ncbi:type II secretion system protein [Bacillus massiliglaciei]|uniref:type II secretion system protein n=1 Tax=Bacillus massiliglaciei TaxID=1816693 RepID=UPI000DA5F074|nr:type II secretion system protein [Bacillus massiliglaciei]